MALLKKSNNWADFSSVFDEAETETPPKRVKKETFRCEEIFKKPNISVAKRPEKIESLSRLVSACDPENLADLAVSKQKQREISNWFARTAVTDEPKILVLSGPSGCGKTSALKIIARDNDREIIEWTTPLDSVAYESYASTRQNDKFLDFLIRATRYNSVLQTTGRRLLLVKDIPNIYLIKPDVFFTLLENYFLYGKAPLVFICTDGGTSKMMKNLFPNDIRQQFGIDVISINSSTQAAMKNVLKRVSVILNSRASHMINVKQRYVDEVLSNSIGDVRSAILNLIFISLKVADNNLRHDCGTREESLGLLHGIGRVINPKRIQVGDDWKFVHDPDDIASYFLSQSMTFLHFLHENYMSTMSSIEEIDECAEIMSVSDNFAYEWRDPNLTKLNLSFCTRGIMVMNKKPVSGWNPVRKPRSEEMTMSRDLGAAEERWYKSIICPRESRNLLNLDNSVIQQYSD